MNNEIGSYKWNTYKPRHMILVLGEHYLVYGKYCRFIKVTNKGFNFLDEGKHKCVLKHHLYDRRYYGKDLPKRIKEIATFVNECADVYHIKKKATA